MNFKPFSDYNPRQYQLAHSLCYTCYICAISAII